jgi:beta-aspartyl-peptidase (threonine type)
MEKTEHVMLIGQGANEFAREVGVAEVEPEQLVSTEAKRKWADYVKYNKVVSDIFNNPKSSTGDPAPPHTPVKEPFLRDHDTVGAVALDLAGNLAAATSTGGISLKRVGRVGDAPLVGSGAYCDNEIGGVSCTGHGESIAKVVLAHRVLNLLQSLQGCGHDRPLSTAAEVVEQSLQFMLQRTGGRGGLIMITSKGEIAKKCTTQRMAWASVNKNGVLESGIE